MSQFGLNRLERWVIWGWQLQDYQFASCDVEDSAKAAKALLKAFKKAGYTSGIEIKEIDGKNRSWKVE